MKERPVDKVLTERFGKQPSLNRRHRGDDARPKRRDALTLGIQAFEKISAVEGIQLTEEMRRDLRSLDARQMGEEERSRFIAGKYGRP